MGLLGGLSFALFYATLGLPIARLADRYNRRLIIVTTLGLFSAMTAMSGLALSFLILFLFRIGVGIGEAGDDDERSLAIALAVLTCMSLWSAGHFRLCGQAIRSVRGNGDQQHG